MMQMVTGVEQNVIQYDTKSDGRFSIYMVLFPFAYLTNWISLAVGISLSERRMPIAFILFLAVLCSALLPAFAEEVKPHRHILAQAGYKDSAKPKVISFGADWCPTCDQLKPALEKAQSRYGNEVDFISVNIDDEKNKDLVRLYKVQGVPEVVFVSPRGKVVETFLGNEPKKLKIGMQKLLQESQSTTSIATGNSSTQ